MDIEYALYMDKPTFVPSIIFSIYSSVKVWWMQLILVFFGNL